ncbi:DUF305 domain-containing protein [Amycolatopsis viridis]|uniref:Uncharacterized protein (DUF305 family) n=1 Tax=Amycolatopsis viridis TaxID=185678 RepID=A0ABX0SN10_9PSEU|nr:DUF305 domain-containing protein [Amycolatopsis viridis]NIH77949.1 uncharacterized protein (DUF305 family) [Amycolatopsis viridis]
MRKILGGLLLTAALLTACTGQSAEPAQQPDHNQADVEFVSMMIPHHEGAVEMAKLAPGRAADPRVLDLAGRVQRAQDPEIQQMRGWLTRWGAPAAPTGHSMPGDTGGDGTAMLEHATGTAFDQEFLRMMTEHHEGAVEMARTELAQGVNGEAKALAQRITETQQAEITEMRAVLG